MYLHSVSAMILDITSLLFLTFWAFDTNESSWFFLFPILWGTTEAIWGTMIWGKFYVFDKLIQKTRVS